MNKSKEELPSVSIRPTRGKNDPARNIGEFFEEASLKDMDSSAIKYWIILLGLGICNSGDASEMLSMNFLFSNNQFVSEILQGDFRSKGSILAACVFLGMMVGGLWTGAYGDQLGRRPILLIGLALNSIAGLASALVPNVYLMCFFRLVSGTGIGAMAPTLYAIAGESSAPSKRGRNVGFVAGFFTFGNIYVAILSLFMFGFNDISWRLFIVICKIPIFIGLFIVIAYIPESARFLALKGRPHEACISANKIADSLGYNGPALEVAEIERRHSNSLGPKKTIVDLIGSLYSPEAYKTTLTIQILWLTVSFGAGIVTWINVVLKQIQVTNLYMMALFFTLATIPGNVCVALLLDRISRRNTMFGAVFFCSLSLYFFARAARFEDPLSAVANACLFSTFNVMSFVTLSVITLELFPTEVRSTGLGLCNATGRLGSIIANIINGALATRPGLLLLVTSIIILLGASTLFFLPDKSNEDLSDTIGRAEHSDVQETLIKRKPNGWIDGYRSISYDNVTTIMW